MIGTTIKIAGKVSTALWVIKTAHKAYRGYQKTAPALKATNKVFGVVKSVKNKITK